MQPGTTQLAQAIGASRALHAANILNAANTWEEYVDLHNQQFADAGLQKFVELDTDGKIVNRSDAMITNATSVRHEDFLVIRDRLVEVRRRGLNGITDLMGRGLSFNVSIEEQLVGFENINEFQAALQSMNPSAGQNNDTVFDESFVPNPITYSGFSVPWRQTGFDYKRSAGLGESGRQVSERLEETLFNGNTSISVSYAGTAYPIYGYTTHPNRGTGTISDWSNIANVGSIHTELITQIGNMWTGQGGVENDGVMVYVANDIWNNLQEDYKADSEASVLERCKRIAQVMDVKPAEKLAAGQVVLVEMTNRTIELAVASDIVAVPHTKTNPLAPQAFTTYAAMVHQIKVDSNSNTGIRHLTT